MNFAYRSHKAFVNLDPGASLLFALPPMTDGTLQIHAQTVFIGGTDQPGDHPGASTGGGPIIDWDLVRNGLDVRRTRGRRATERRRSTYVDLHSLPGRRATARRKPVHPIDPGTLDPEIDPGTGPATELTFELLYGRTVVQTKVGKAILYQVNSSGDAWALRITRAPDTNGERRRYRIDASYSSVLPLEERRIPMKFLQNGFDRNWNDDTSYLEMLEISGKHIFYRWSEKLSALYGLERETSIPISGTEDIDFPEIIARSVRISAGHENRAPSLTNVESPYFSLHIDFECANSTTIDATGPDDIDLPRTFWMEVRLYIDSLGGSLFYSPEILTNLKVEGHVMWVAVDMDEKIRDAEQHLHMKQWGGGGSAFGSVIGPWMVGHYETVDVHYDEARDAMVIGYVGKPVEREMVFSDAPPTRVSRWATLPKLFGSADDEKWGPTKTLGGAGGEPLHQSSPGNLAKVDHIIVLMQENRSFDQVFGYLSRDGHPNLGVQEIEGLLPGVNDRDVNEYRLSPISDPIKFRSAPTSDTSWPFRIPGPCHGRDCVKAQITAGMKHFVGDWARRLHADATPENLQRIMNYYPSAALPVYAALANDFVVCDHWFCSHIGGTLPNRHITLSGDLNVDKFGLPEEDNSEFSGYAPSERPTFFDQLTARNVSWRVFEHGYSFLRLYRNFTFDVDRVVEFDDPDRGFEKLADLDELPQVCFIEPDYIELPDGNDDHAPADMHNGQRLVARIVRALIRSGNWKNSLLIITYDEHGGFYDHLIPPSEIVEGEGATRHARPIPPLANDVTQLGPRVPAVIISPLIPGETGKVSVDSTVYEHASIPATILRRFCAPFVPRISPRVDGAKDMRDLLTLDPLEFRAENEFAALLQVCDQVAASAVRRDASANPSPVPTRKIADRNDDDFKEDFHGFVAFASSVTGRGI